MKLRALLFLLLCCSLHGASYYVDYATGSDSANGTSTSTPWQHCPGDPAATSTSAARYSTGFSAGDTIFFKGGVTYTFTGATGIIVGHSGSSGNPITYDGNSAGTWGTGRAILTDNYSATAREAFSGANTARSYISIKNFHITNMGGTATLPTDLGSGVSDRPGHGIVFTANTGNPGVTGLVVDNCKFDGLGYVFNAKPMQASSINGEAVYLINPVSYTITNSEFTRCRDGISALYSNTGSTGGTITNCTFHDKVVWCLTIASQTSTSVTPATTISECTFYNTSYYDDPNWTGYGEWPHTDGIFLRKDGNNAAWGTTSIYNCRFYQNEEGGGGSAWISITEGPNADIFNCEFIYAQKGSAIFLNNSGTTSTAQVLRFLNNSFLFENGKQFWLQQTSGFSNTTLTIKNNIFKDTTTGSGNNFAIYMSASTLPNANAFDYNLYDSQNTTTPGTHGGVQGTEFFSSEGQGEGGLNKMSTIAGGSGYWESHGQNDDPDFTTVDVLANALLCVLTLQPLSPAINAGENLTSLGITALNTDKAGNARPSSGAWDLGPFEYVPSIIIYPPAKPRRGAAPATVAPGF